MAGRWVLSAAGPRGGFTELAAEPFTVDAGELPGRAAGLADWARERMVAGFVPAGLYMACCDVEVARDADPLIVASRSFAWADLGPWPLDPWTHPALLPDTT